SSSSPSSSSSCISRQVDTIRDLYLERIKEKYPNFTPRNDFEILAIGAGDYKGPESHIYEWLDKEFSERVEYQGSVQRVLSAAEKIIGRRDIITGHKPKRGTPGVFVRPIPQSSYSVRLFPGSPRAKEYCMDFVHTTTGEPVNSPFAFELWSVANPSTLQPSGRVFSLEVTWGREEKNLRPGTEKFVLRDGTTYVLKRRGHRPLRFKVPVRVRPIAKAPEMDELVFPETVYVD
ncbi:hypothetical protein C8Q76DRAFT_568810, partial [Earliella scabrosa]